MAELTCREAVAAAIAQEMRRDPSVVFLGEDIGAAGGVFKTTVGLFEEFGPERVRDTPISEQAIIGAAMGAAMTGLRPIAELMFSDFFAVCWDLVANEIAKSRYMTNGQVSFPLVIRSANGGGARFGAQHSQAIENWAMMIPGLKVVAPSNPADIVGLLAASIRDPDPVVFFEQKSLYGTRGPVPDGEHVDTLGTAKVVREGSDAAIVALAAMVPRAAEAANRLAEEGISCRVIDVRTLVPLDTQTILSAVSETGRLFTVEETLGSAAGARRYPRSRARNASTTSTGRSSASPRPIYRCLRRTTLRIWRCPRSSGSSTPSASTWAEGAMDVVMPQLGETVTEGTVTAWHKAAGDPVKADEILFEVSTDKVDTEVPAPADGVLSEILVEAGATVPVGTRLAVIGGAGESAGAAPPTAAALAGTPVKGRSIPLDSVPRKDSGGRPLSPAVRRLIAEHGLDTAVISGTGRDGRITRQDVEALLAPEPAESDLVPLGRMRKQIAEHMVRSKATSPHVLQAVEVDFHAVERARNLHGEAWKAKEGFSLSYLPFIAHATCRAIPDFPHVNASIEGDNLRIHRRVHLGIAVDLGPGGLMAPVIRDAQEMDVAGSPAPSARSPPPRGTARSGRTTSSAAPTRSPTRARSGP